VKVGIIGRNGFIGSALAERFSSHEIYSYPRKDLDILYHFGSPSSDIIFKQNMDWCFNETIQSFLHCIQFCRDNKIRFVYPSSATVYQGITVYSKAKRCLEEIHSAYGGDVLGLRIFAGYGVGEEHKGEYSSIIYQFCLQMANGVKPVIYGDGNQTRDFIYIDDIVEAIIEYSQTNGMRDIGTGINTSFNEIIRLINKSLHTSISPIYVDKPSRYADETPCNNPVKCAVSIEEGIDRICKTLL
jgi:UDP-glucose 4-epimerase